MDARLEIGVIVTVEAGGPRLRPLEFSYVDGEWWAATSQRVGKALSACDARHVELVFVEGDVEPELVRGTLACSTAPADRHRLWQEQGAALSTHFRTADDPDLVVVKVTPAEAERAVFPRRDGRQAA